MEIISLSKSDLESLIPIERDCAEIEENTLYFYEDNSVIEIFKYTDSETLENKRRKIELLNQLGDENIAKPEKLVYVDGILAGFSRKNYIGAKTLYDLAFSTKKRKLISILKRIKNIVLNLHKKRIRIIDFNPNNFLLVGENIILCGSDNWHIEDFKSDVLTDDTKRLISNGFSLDEIERYNFNIMTISVLKRIWRPHVLKSIRNRKLFLNKQAREIVEAMSILNKGETRYIVDCFEEEKRLKLF